MFENRDICFCRAQNILHFDFRWRSLEFLEPFMQDSEAFSESFNSSNVYDEALLDVCQGSEFASVA